MQLTSPQKAQVTIGYAICQYANKENTETIKSRFSKVPQVCSVDPDAYIDSRHGDFRLCLR